MAEHASEGDRVNVQTQHLHGLRAANNMIGLVRQLVRAGAVKLKGIEIILDNGEKFRLKASEYVDLAEASICKSIVDLKARHERPQPGLN